MTSEDKEISYAPDPKGPKKITWLTKFILIVCSAILAIEFLPAEAIFDRISGKRLQSEEKFLSKREDPVRSKLLLDDAYTDRIKKEIRNADKSIRVLMYIFHLGKRKNRMFNPAYKLARLLRFRAREGVDVRVALSSIRDKPNKGFVEKNRKTAEFLRKAGVKAVVEPVPDRLHAKLVMIDEKKLFVANHNWTFSALKYNAEVAMYFEGPGIRKHIPIEIKRLMAKAFQ